MHTTMAAQRKAQNKCAKVREQRERERRVKQSCVYNAQELEVREQADFARYCSIEAVILQEPRKQHHGERRGHTSERAC